MAQTAEAPCRKEHAWELGLDSNMQAEWLDRKLGPQGVSQRRNRREVTICPQYLVATGETVHNVEALAREHDLPTKLAFIRDICRPLSMSSVWTNPVRSLSSGWPYGGQRRTAGHSFRFNLLHSVYATAENRTRGKVFNKDGDGLDIYKIITFYSLDSGLPVSFL